MTELKRGVTGLVRISIKDGLGSLVMTVENKNRITDSGLNMIARYWAGDPSYPIDPLSHLGIGTGTTAAGAGDVALQSEALPRALITQQTNLENVATIIGEFSGASIENIDLSELGVFNASTGGDMLARVVLASPIRLPVGFTLAIQWDITVSYNQTNTRLVFTNSGLDSVADRLVGGTTSPISHMALGTGQTFPVSPLETALEAETERGAISAKIVIGGSVVNMAEFSGPLSSIAEVGTFNSAIGGVMAARQVYDGVLTFPAGITRQELTDTFVYGGV